MKLVIMMLAAQRIQIVGFYFKQLNDPEIEASFNQDYLNLLRKWQFRTITVLIDKLEHQRRYQTWRYDSYHYCMAILFERYHLIIKELGQSGDMMFESRGGKEDMRLKDSYRRIFAAGTEWIQPSDIDETITSKELKIRQKIANVAGLQVADLLAYPLYRYSLKFFGLKDDVRPTFNDQILEVIKSKIFQ